VQATRPSIVNRPGLDANTNLLEAPVQTSDVNPLVAGISDLPVPESDIARKRRLKSIIGLSGVPPIADDELVEDDSVGAGTARSAMTGVSVQTGISTVATSVLNSARSGYAELRYPVLCPELLSRPVAGANEPLQRPQDVRAALLQALSSAVAAEVAELKQAWGRDGAGAGGGAGGGGGGRKSGRRRCEEKATERLEAIARRAERKCNALVMRREANAALNDDGEDARLRVDEMRQLEARCARLEEECAASDARRSAAALAAAAAVAKREEEEAARSAAAAAAEGERAAALRQLQQEALNDQLARQRFHKLEANIKQLAEREEDIKKRAWAHLPGGELDGLRALAAVA